MFSFREIQNCDGYYYNVRTGEVLRNVGPGDRRCWLEGSWRETTAVGDLEAPEFELLAEDVTTPFATVQRLVAEKYAQPACHVLNRQTAVQPDGGTITEEAPSPLPCSESSEDASCRRST